MKPASDEVRDVDLRTSPNQTMPGQKSCFSQKEQTGMPYVKMVGVLRGNIDVGDA